jgi:hypothetical protein
LTVGSTGAVVGTLHQKSCTNAEKNTLDVYGVTLRVRTSGSKTKQTIRTS